MEIRELGHDELGRIGEIDRSESVRFKYVYEHGALRPVEINHEIPTWNEAMVADAIRMLEPKLREGGVFLGAFDGDRMVGVAVLGGALIGRAHDQLQLAFLYVSNGYRRLGLARRLLDEVCALARMKGARQLYISATETESAVGFYLGYGCRLAGQVDEELYRLEPLDIHLTLDLTSRSGGSPSGTGPRRARRC
jgi:ribosomal protein S18 acetylase RimI-like enzyme